MSTFEELNSMEDTMRYAREVGQLVLVHSGSLHREYTIVPNEDVAEHITMTVHPVKSLLGDMLPEFDITTSRMKVVGATRRKGLRRRFISAPIDSYFEGDRLVLEDKDGLRLTTRKINMINPPDELIEP